MRGKQVDVGPTANSGDDDVGRKSGASDVGAAEQGGLGSSKGREGRWIGVQGETVRGDCGGRSNELASAGGRPLRGTPRTPVSVQYLPPSVCWVLYTIKILAPELLTTARMLLLHVCTTVHA